MSRLKKKPVDLWTSLPAADRRESAYGRPYGQLGDKRPNTPLSKNMGKGVCPQPAHTLAPLAHNSTGTAASFFIYCGKNGGEKHNV